jgi:predicted transposase YbfD/YdcC
VSVSHAAGVGSGAVAGVLGLPQVLPGADAVRALVGMFEQVNDPRDPRGLRHRLATVLTVAVFAVLAGAQNYRQVGDRVADLPQALVALAGARECPALGVVEAPSGSTIRRVLTLVDADAADRVVGSWLASLVDSDDGGLAGLAMDAKTVCGAGGTDGDVTLFSAMAHGVAVVVGQVRVPAATTETTQVRALLDGVELAGLAVTADAAHAQADTAEYIVFERGGDYILQVKANQVEVLRQIAAVMPAAVVATADWSEVEQCDGDTIRRSIWVVDADRVDFPEAARVFRILRERFDPFGQRVSKEVVHGVTSVPAHRATPAQIAGFVRAHWGIESRHWLRDVVFGEDSQGAYVGNGPHSMAILRNLVLSLLRLAGVSQVKRLTESIAADRMRILPVLAAALKQ